MAGLEPQFLALDAPRFRLEEAALRAALKPNTRAIVVCTPSNPSGHMLDRDEIAALDRVARESDLLVITDEIYEYIRYDGREHVSPAAIGSARSHGDDHGPVEDVQHHRLAPRLRRRARRRGARDRARARSVLHLRADAAAVRSRRWFPCAAELLRGPGRVCAEARVDVRSAGTGQPRSRSCPRAPYYVLADIGHLGFANARDAAMAILEQTKVATIPGTSFFQGAAGEKLVRVCYAKEDDVLLRGLRAGLGSAREPAPCARSRSAS